MPVGRKPKPTKMHVLNGNPSRKDLTIPEPEPNVCIPAIPNHLSRESRNEWERISKELYTLGLLSNLDMAALAGYCQAYGRWVMSENQIKKYGEVIKAPSGYPVQSPYLNIANKALDQMHRFLTEFGMTPSSRSRINIDVKKENNQDIEELLSS